MGCWALARPEHLPAGGPVQPRVKDLRWTMACVPAQGALSPGAPCPVVHTSWRSFAILPALCSAGGASLDSWSLSIFLSPDTQLALAGGSTGIRVSICCPALLPGNSPTHSRPQGPSPSSCPTGRAGPMALGPPSGSSMPGFILLVFKRD